MLCTDCIHKDVCGLEGSWDEALITCKHKTELPNNTGHWIEMGNDVYKCSECGDGIIYKKSNYCHNCGAKMD